MNEVGSAATGCPSSWQTEIYGDWDVLSEFALGLQQHVTVGSVGGSVSLVVELGALKGILDETGVVGDPTRPEWHEDYAKLSKGKGRLF